MKKRIFGEWLKEKSEGKMLKLVIEEMNAGSEDAAVKSALLVTEPDSEYEVVYSKNSSVSSITWVFTERVQFLSLKVEQLDLATWIRRYRIEVSDDGNSWHVNTPSVLLDAYHRQPCCIKSSIVHMDSSLIPDAKGTSWCRSFYEDFLMRSIEELGEDSPYPDWLSANYFLVLATKPFGFGGVYVSGDVASFDCLIASIFSPEIAVETEKVLTDMVSRYGFIPAIMVPNHKDDTGIGLDYSGFNWVPLCYVDIYSWTREKGLLEWFAQSCEKWAEWILDNRDRNHDGWLEPGINGKQSSTEEFRKAGAASHPEIARRNPEYWDFTCLHNTNLSAFQAAIFELATDDYPFYVNGRHRGVRFDTETDALSVHYIDQQLIMSFLSRFIAYASKKSDKADKAEYFEKIADHYSNLVKDYCWDETTGFYYDREADTGELRTFVKHVGGFIPMVLGIPTLEQARRMVEHLLDTRAFWTEYPVPSISMDSPDFLPHGYWSGRTWPPFNHIII